MAKWILNRPGVWEYDFLGFIAADGDILEADNAPDAYWDAATGDPAETVTRYGREILTPGPYVETPDGHVLTYDQALNKFVPKPASGGSGGGSKVYSEPGATPGFHTLLDLDYDTTDPATNEPYMVRVRDAGGTVTKSFWLNESGLARVWAVAKDEPGLKVHAFDVAGDNPVLEIRDAWNQGAARRWGVNGAGQMLLGPNQAPAGAVVRLGPAEAVPAGLPADTIIARIDLGPAVAENLLTDPGFEVGLAEWSSGQATITRNTDGGHRGDGYLVAESTGTGNRNILHSPIWGINPGEVFSCAAYARWDAGATPKNCQVMCQFLDEFGAQTANFKGASVLMDGTWQQMLSENATAPALSLIHI